MFRKRAGRIRGVAGTLDGMSVLVVDAALGPGSGIVRVLAEAGAAVTAASATMPELAVQSAKVQSPIPVSQVAYNPDESEALLANLASPIDALVLNPSLDAQPDIAAAITIARGAATQMQDRGHPGSITFVTTADRGGRAGEAAAQIRIVVEDLAAELATNGIRVNEVAPGPVGVNRRGNPVSHRATPLGHVTVHPVEVGKAVWFMMNDGMSGGVTGATLKVDRGASLAKPAW